MASTLDVRSFKIVLPAFTLEKSQGVRENSLIECIILYVYKKTTTKCVCISSANPNQYVFQALINQL
mgnify:CR=1 FL=1